jgi:hypothetical protein
MRITSFIFGSKRVPYLSLNVLLPAMKLPAWLPIGAGFLGFPQWHHFRHCKLKEERIMSNSDSGKVDLHKGQISSQPRESQETLDSIMDGLAEEFLSIPDEELLAEAVEEGRNPIQEAEAIRKSLLNMVRAASLKQPRMTVRRSGSDE